MPPDPQKFESYYDRQLEPLMRRETQLFFAEVLRKNLSIDHFINSDFTFANRYLAAHYGLPKVAGDEFRRITLPKQSLRGGLLGHASVLTATSNGVETSPVTRASRFSPTTSFSHRHGRQIRAMSACVPP